MSLIIRWMAVVVAALLIVGCTYTIKVQDGATALDRKQYAVAVNMLKKEYNKADSRVEKGRVAYRLGQAYEGLNEGAEAIAWYKIAYDNQYGYDALKAYAYSLKQAERYADAKEAFKELGVEIGSPYQYRKEIQACEQAEQWIDNKRQEYRLSPAGFNASASDYAATPIGGGRLIFTSDRALATGDETYKWTGKSFSDLFYIDSGSNQPTPLPPTINTPANEGTAIVSPDQKELYFTRCSGAKNEDAFCQLMLSRQQAGGEWGPAQPLEFMKPGANYMHPALSGDGKQLYFSSNNEDSWGGYDIFVSMRGADGVWGAPAPLSRNINTPNDEQFPWLDQDTLYFASDGHPGMGGLDVFRTQRASNGAWLTPRNMQAPINSGADDFAFFLDRGAKPQGDVLALGYVSSRRTGGEGADDVYVLEKVKLPPLPPKPPVEIVYKNWLEVYVLEKIYRQPGDPNSEVIGRKPLPGATLEITLGRDARKVTVDDNGMFKLELKDNADYNFLASAPGLLTGQSSFSSKGIGRDPDRPEQTFELEVVLERIFVDKEIRLENIYYDFDQWFIRDDAKPTLDELANLLKINPAVRIQLGSHTDCRGSDAYNEQLSQRRAQSAVDYLIAQGIDPARLEARGYGESVPANDCLCARCTEDEHQYNRRTTFKIVE